MSKPKFDPTKPFEVVDSSAQAKPKFDPSQPYEVVDGDATTPKPQTSAVMAYLEAQGNRAAMGYGPFLQAAFEPATDAIYGALRGDFLKKPEDRVGYGDQSTLRQRMDQNIARNQLQRKEHPTAVGLGDFVGNVTGAVATGAGAGAALRGLGLLSQTGQAAGALARAPGFIRGSIPALFGTGAAAESVGGRIAQGALGGAGSGLLSNPGDTIGEDSGLQLGPRLENAVIGGAGGALFSAGGELLSGAKGYLKGLANRQAFNALGPAARDAKMALAKGDVENIGAQLLDNGVIGVVPRSYGTIAERAGKAAEKSGAELGALRNELEQAQIAKAVSGQNPNLVNKKDIASELEKTLSQSNELHGSPEFNAKVKSAANYYDASGNPELTINQAARLKKQVGNRINWKKLPGMDVSDAEQIDRGLYNILKNAEEKSAEAVAGDAGKQTLAAYKGLKNKYGALSAAEMIAKNKEASTLANRLISPSDYGVGLIGSVIGANKSENPVVGGLTGAALGLLNKGARQYGSQITAKTANTASNLIPGFLANMNKDPALTQAIINRLLNNPNRTMATDE